MQQSCQYYTTSTCHRWICSHYKGNFPLLKKKKKKKKILNWMREGQSSDGWITSVVVLLAATAAAAAADSEPRKRQDNACTMFTVASWLSLSLSSRSLFAPSNHVDCESLEFVNSSGYFLSSSVSSPGTAINRHSIVRPRPSRDRWLSISFLRLFVKAFIYGR